MIVNFFKSLVIPIRMAKYRHMSALISIIIFVLSAYLLALPYRKNVEKSVLSLKEDYSFLAVEEIPDTEENLAVIKEIDSLECSINTEKALTCANLPEDTDFKRTISYEKEGITKHINIIIDVYNETKYEKFTGFTLEEYPYVDLNENYFIVFTKNTIIFQANQLGIDKNEVTHNEQKLAMTGFIFKYKDYFPDFQLSFDDENAQREFGSFVVDKLIEAYRSYSTSQSFIGSLMLAVIYPLLMVALFWLFFRKNGRLTRFKEYYNIAAIVSIIPILITFAVSWVYPVVFQGYIFIFSLYYLFNLYKINNSPELD